jgi:colanic acid/amylovoran biosynthesis protein
LNCSELKYIISKCRFLIAARTHASIAAYSTCVPTLVVGYSVKAKGIAKDIFGTDDNYVIPVQSLKENGDLIKAFKWIQENEDKIRIYLQRVMPDYCAKVWLAGDEIKKLLI